MNNLTKKLPFLVSVATALTLTCLAVYQTGIIDDLRTELHLTVRKLGVTEESLETERKLNAQLLEEITVLRDSLGILEHVIAGLNEKVEALKKTIAGMNATIQQKEDKVIALTLEISRLNKNSEVNARKINDLATQRDNLLSDMKRLDDDREHLRRERDAAAKDQVAQSHQKEKVKVQIEQKQEEVKPEHLETAAAPLPKINRSPESEAPAEIDFAAEKQQLIKNADQKRLHKILSETKVRFSNIALRSKEEGKNLKKLRENGWRFTLIEFNLEHAEPDLIDNEKFLLQLFDVDHQKVVPLNEKNQNFPDSPQGSAGRPFTYLGAPLSINYVNTQKKEANNYEIRMYYLKDDLMMPLQNGTLTIVKNGEVVRK